MKLHAQAVLALALCLSSNAYAQTDEKPKEIELDNFRTPASPAFTLLDVSPTTIARPTTPRALSTELLSKTHRGSIIPNNYALEVAPFWLVPHPTLSYKQYTEPSLAQSIVQSFSVSLATARADSTSDTSSTQVALGLRILPLGGRVSSKFLALQHQLDTIQRRRLGPVRDQADALDEVDETVAELLVLRRDLEAARAANNTARANALRTQIGRAEARRSAARSNADAATEILARQADTLRTLALEMGSARAEKVGFFLELAAGLAASIPQGDFDHGKFSRAGTWGTLGYRLESPHIDLLGLLRLLRDVRKEDQNALDAGGRIHLALHNVGISGEWVNRTAYKIESAIGEGSADRTLSFSSSSRATAIVDYRAAEDIYITMTFGRDYKKLTEARHPLVAAVGFQFLFGQKPVVKLP